MNRIRRRMAVPALLLAILAAWQIVSIAQQDVDKDDTQTAPLARSGTHFEFEVIESFDAKYLGDTPGHIGRAGGLTGVRPRVSLGDPVYRGDTRIGEVSTVLWSRVQGSLTIEFDPVPLTRVSVGDQVWIDLNPSNPRGSE